MRVSRLELKKMDKEKVKKEFTRLAIEVDQLSRYIETSDNLSEHDKFMDDFGYCLNTLHALRSRLDDFYFNPSK